MPEWVWMVAPWLVVLLCVLGEAFFAGTELAIVSANGIRLQSAADAGNAAARRVIWFRERPDQLFGTTLLGTNMCTVTGSAVASLTLMQVDPHRGEFWAMLLMSPVILIGGEIIPKSLATTRATVFAKALAGPLLLANRLLFPFIAVIRAYTRFLYRRLGIDEAAKSAIVSREELFMLMQSEAVDDEFDADEREMISRIFAFSRLRARDSMVPLVEMVAVPAGSTVREAAGVISTHGVSRLPVYEGRVDNVVGLLHHLDLLRAEDGEAPVSGLMRPPNFVPESQEVDEILVMLKQESASAAMVVDEFGGTVGLLTLEDVLEEIVGEIDDEFDGDPEAKLWRRIPEGVLIDARAPVGQLNDALELDLPEGPGDYETIAGYLLEQLRHIPRVGESVTLSDGRRLTVRRSSRRAIQELLLTGTRRKPG